MLLRSLGWIDISRVETMISKAAGNDARENTVPHPSRTREGYEEFQSIICAEGNTAKTVKR